MDLERERGITIKAQAVRMTYTEPQGQTYQLNLIDTPGHVDFSHEVSRSLAACEGALLVVDATQGIQAQTLANVYLAMEHDLVIIPVINKIDLDVAEPARVSLEVQQAFGFTEEEITFASAKDGDGVEDLLRSIIQRIPVPTGRASDPLRALIFDSKYDSYKGVVAYVRVFDGEVPAGERVRVLSTGADSEALELGFFRPGATKVDKLGPGEVGYIATGLKSVGDAPVGDTITLSRRPAQAPLKAHEPLKPMVFAGLYPADGEDYLALREALEKLQLNDAALTFQPESSLALGSGFRCGFLGLLHMDVVQERLEREYDLVLLATSPSVAYRVVLTDGTVQDVENPSKLPDPQRIAEIQEPWIDLSVITPATFIGAVMDLVENRQGEYKRMEYLQQTGSNGDAASDSVRVLLEYSVPLSEVLVDFYDRLKGRTQGYASMGLLAGWIQTRQARQARNPRQRRARRPSFGHRPQGGGLPPGKGPGGEAADAHPASAFRGANSGVHRQQDRRAGDHQGAPEECPGQVLRRRRNAKAQAARKTGRRQKADEARGSRGDSAGGLHGRIEDEPELAPFPAWR